jgi:L-threonylcarbamoyladenylate synthase
MSTPCVALAGVAAIQHVAAGGLLGFPTETSWGLGADARSDAALEALQRWKGMDPAQPISLLVAGSADLARLEAKLSPGAQRLAARFWPGPLTLVVRCEARLARGIAGAEGAVGLRCSSHPAAAALATLASAQGVGPLTATSLNRSGQPACATRREAEAYCGGQLPLLAGPDSGGAPASSVVDATGREPRVLRSGTITAAEIAAVWAGGCA